MKTTRNKTIAFWLPLCVLACLVAGCNEDRGSVVTGTVTVDGDLADNGTVTFHPKAAGPVATGRVFPDGTFRIRVGQGDRNSADSGTLKPGEYNVTVAVYGAPGPPEQPGGPPSPGPLLNDPKYVDPSASPLKLTVVAGDNIFNIDLEPAPQPQDAAGEQVSDGTDAPAEAGGAGTPTMEAVEPVEDESVPASDSIEKPEALEDAGAISAPTDPQTEATGSETEKVGGAP